MTIMFSLLSQSRIAIQAPYDHGGAESLPSGGHCEDELHLRAEQTCPHPNLVH